MKTPYVVLAALVVLFLAALYVDQPYQDVETPDLVTIRYWEKWTGFEGEALRATVELFNSKQIRNKKGQVIRCKVLSVTNVDRKSILAIAGGTPPDLVGFWSQNTHVFADMNALIPLDEYIARDGFDMSRYIRVYDEGFRHRGHIWCLCTTPASVALHWNKDLFKEAGLDPERPPRTIPELEEFAGKIVRKDPQTGRVTRMGFLPPEPGWWNWAWGYYFGGKLNDGLEKITADDPGNIAALEWVEKFAERYGREEMLAFRQGFGSFDSPQNAFLSGKVGMVLQGVWMSNFIRFHNPFLNYGCAPFPAAFDTKGEPVTIAEMDVITLPRGCRHPDEAWEVIKFINSQEGMEYLCGDRENNNGGQGKLTPFKTNRPGWIEQHTHPHLRVFIDLAKSKNAVSTPKLAVWMEYRDELSAAFDRVWLGQATPEEALRTVQERIQPKLDRALLLQRIREGGR